MAEAKTIRSNGAPKNFHRWRRQLVGGMVAWTAEAQQMRVRTEALRYALLARPWQGGSW